MKNFIEISDLSTDELMSVLDRADALQKLWPTRQMPKSLSNQSVALWFFGHGFRNRMAFEIGARALGADVSFVPGDSLIRCWLRKYSTNRRSDARQSGWTLGAGSGHRHRGKWEPRNSST